MIGLVVWVGGSAMVLYEAVAVVTKRRTVSRARGIWRVGIFAWLIAFAVHLILEMVSDDLGRRMAADFGTPDR